MKKLIYALMLFVLLLVPVRSVHALTGPLDGRVIIGDNFTLKSGDTLDGDLVVIGGEVVIEAGATVKGEIVVIGGSLTLDGKGTGDAVVIGGLASLGAKASLAGDMVTVGGSLQRAETAMVGGNVVTNMPPPTILIPNPANANVPPVPPTPRFELDFNPFWQIANVFFQALVLGALAMLLTVFLHPQLDRVAQAIVQQPFIAGGIGLLTTFFAAPIALVVFGLTLILIPVALTVPVLLVLAWLFGMAALGTEVGTRFTRALHQNWAPVLSGGLGTFMLAIVVGGLNQIPCVGWMAALLVGLIGIGAVVVTIFGTRPVSQLGLSATGPHPQSASTGSLPPAS
jgi:hypothetical protein